MNMLSFRRFTMQPKANFQKRRSPPSGYLLSCGQVESGLQLCTEVSPRANLPIMNLFRYLLILQCFVAADVAVAIDCPDNNYTFSSQEAIDEFGLLGCSRILGYLSVRSSTNITSLESLSNIESIGSSLGIGGTGLLTLDGLDNLSSVGGSIEIYSNNSLTDLSGLGSVNRVGGRLQVYNNASLTNLAGLSGFSSVGGEVRINANPLLASLDGLANITSVGLLHIANNDALTNLDGLANLTRVGSDLYIGENSALRNLDGLVSLTSVGGALQIGGVGALTNLDGLANLTSVAGSLFIHSNVALRDIDGLSKLSSVGDFLSIGNNDSLTNLDGLANLTSVASNLDITQNTALAHVDGLANLTGVGGFLTISINDSLQNLDGLASLTSVGGFLSINYNTALTNVDGLASLTNVGGDLEIVSNNSLANCQGLALVLGWPSGPPADDVVGDIKVSNGIGCTSVQQVLDSISVPTQPVINQPTTSSTSIYLGFTSSTTTNTAFPITGYSASCTGSEVDVSGSPATDLFDNTPITETLTVSGYDPTSVLSSIEVDIDITHSDPADLYITLTTPEGTELVLWNQGSSGGGDLFGTFPTTLTSVDSLDRVTRQTMDGDWVLSIEDIDVGPLVREGVLNSWGIGITEELARNGSGSPIEVFGATRGRDYTCTVAPVTKLGTTPVSDPYTVTVPLELPSVPAITSTDYEDGKIILTVSVSDNGGTAITGYQATCIDGTNTFTGTSTSSPITVSGLTNEVAYTCTVTATNSVGTSSASAATDPITPERRSTGLPIWLLYQATQ